MYKYRWVAFLGDRKELQRKTKCYRIRGGALRAKIALPLLQLLSFAEKSRRTTRGPWCLDPPMLGDPKARPTELRMTPAAPHGEDSRVARSRSHTRTSVQQHSLPTVIRSARTVSQVRPDAARGRAQSSGERAHLVVVYTSKHLRVITVNQLCRPSRLFSRMVSTRHRCANVVHNSVLQNVL